MTRKKDFSNNPNIQTKSSSSPGIAETRANLSRKHDQPQLCRGRITRGRNLSISGMMKPPRFDLPSGSTQVVRLQDQGRQGANLPFFMEDPEKEQAKGSLAKKVLFPRLLMNAHRRSTQWNVRKLSLQGLGQDMMLPTPTAVDLTIKKKRCASWHMSPEARSKLQQSGLDTEDEQEDVIKDTSEDVLWQILQCHSVGIPLKFAGKSHESGARCVVPLLHCPRCLEAWKANNQVCNTCPYPEDPVPGPEMTVDKETLNFIKKIWDIHLLPNYGTSSPSMEDKVQKPVQDINQTFKSFKESTSGNEDTKSDSFANLDRDEICIFPEGDTDAIYSDLYTGLESELDPHSNDFDEEGKKIPDEDSFQLEAQERVSGPNQDGYRKIPQSTEEAHSRKQRQGHLTQPNISDKGLETPKERFYRQISVRSDDTSDDLDEGWADGNEAKDKNRPSSSRATDHDSHEKIRTLPAGKESSNLNFSESRRSANLSRASRSSSMTESGRSSSAPRIQILDPDTLATESMAKNGKRRDTLSGLQSAQTRRKSISTLADIPRESTGVHHIGQLEDSQNNDTKDNEPITQRRKSSLRNPSPDSDDNFRFSSGARAPISLARESPAFADTIDGKINDTALLTEVPDGSLGKTSPTLEEITQARVAPLPQLPKRREYSAKRPVAQIKPTISARTIENKDMWIRVQGNKSKRSESGESLFIVRHPNLPLIIPDFKKISNLSFTPAFTFSYYPNIPYPKPVGKRAAGIKKFTSIQKTATKNVQNLMQKEDKISLETARIPKTDVTMIAKKMRHKFENPKPTAKYVKNPSKIVPTSQAKENEEEHFPKKEPLALIKKRTKDTEFQKTTDISRRTALLRPSRIVSSKSFGSAQSTPHHSISQARRPSRYSMKNKRNNQGSSPHAPRNKVHPSQTSSVKPATVVKLAYQHSTSRATMAAKFKPCVEGDKKIDSQEKAKESEGSKDSKPFSGFAIEFEPEGLLEAESVIIRVTD